MSFSNLAIPAALLTVFCTLAIVLPLKAPVRNPGNLPAPSASVVELALQGKKVSAIREYRRDFKVSLREAEQLVSTIVANGGA